MDVDRTWTSTLVKNHDENKTYILVKLSESFSNAIQEYSAPKIKFHGSRGAFRFPNGKSYDFSLEQSDNTVECIRQYKNRWESVGKMACCLHVKGKDDVYQRTRTKMEAAEQEKRKYCTKLLGSPEHESIDNTPTTKSSRTSSSLAPSNHNPSYYSTHLSNHNNNANHHHSSNRSSRSIDSSSNHKSSSSYNNLTCPSSNQAHTATLSSNAAPDLKTSLLSSLSTGSATSSSSSSASSSSVAAATSNNNYSNYLSKFPDILDVEQMHRYKAEFDKDFKEYQHLHGYLHRIEERFGKLKETLQRSIEGSSEWESAKEEIFNEYERLEGDSNFHKARSKYQQLYNKLNHIKKKLFQFKHDNRDKCNSRKKRRR